MKPNVVFEHQVGRRRLWYASQHGWFKHFHYPAELIIPLDGDFILAVDDTDYVIKKEECGIVFPYQPHEIKGINCDSSIIIFAEPGRHPSLQKYLTEYLPVSNRVEKRYFPDWIPDLVRDFKRTSYKWLDDQRESEMYASMDGLAQLICNEVLRNLPVVKAEGKRDLKTLNNIIDWCNAHFTEPVTLDDAARGLFLSKSSISHMMSKDLQISFTRYINLLRTGRACELLKSTDRQISEIAFESGFGSIWSFNRNFQELVGMTPGDYRVSRTNT